MSVRASFPSCSASSCSTSFASGWLALCRNYCSVIQHPAATEQARKEMGIVIDKEKKPAFVPRVCLASGVVRLVPTPVVSAGAAPAGKYFEYHSTYKNVSPG